MMESFFSTIKIERVARKVYRTRSRAYSDLFDYIEVFYNPTRRHSTLGYVSPIKFEEIQLAWVGVRENFSSSKDYMAFNAKNSPFKKDSILKCNPYVPGDTK